jgi:predicted nucleic acid-binding Zn ribbon protein
MASLTLKIAVVAPMPNAMVRTEVTAKPGALARARTPNRTSFHKLIERNTIPLAVSIQILAGGWVKRGDVPAITFVNV